MMAAKTAPHQRLTWSGRQAAPLSHTVAYVARMRAPTHVYSCNKYEFKWSLSCMCVCKDGREEEVFAFPIIILLISESADMYLKLAHTHHPESKKSNWMISGGRGIYIYAEYSHRPLSCLLLSDVAFSDSIFLTGFYISEIRLYLMRRLQQSFSCNQRLCLINTMTFLW